MLGFADPSAHVALGEGDPAERVTVDGIGFDLDADGGGPGGSTSGGTAGTASATGERQKAGLDVLAKAYRDLAP